VIPPELEDGWYATGDLGQWHEGELVVLGRADNRFISGGENISCEEIESALMNLYSSYLKMLGSARIDCLSDKTPIGRSSGSKSRIGNTV
jgi:acyl-CoA synthetase (AMP-forming)/AMP-acid ligase II